MGGFVANLADQGFRPSVLGDSLELYIGSAATGRAAQGSTTLDLVQFTQLPGQSVPGVLTQQDVGALVAIIGGGPVDPLMPPIYFVQGATFVTTIAAVTDASTCTLDDAPVTSIYNSGFVTVIVFRHCVMQLDSVQYKSSIAPGTNDTVKGVILTQDNAYIARFETIANGQPVYFRSSDPDANIEFGGSIDNCQTQSMVGVPTPFAWSISCNSWRSIPARRKVGPNTPTTYASTAGDDVFKHVVFDNLDDEGVSVDADAAPEIDFGVPAGAAIDQLLDQIVAKITVAAGEPWYWRPGPFRQFLLRPRSAVAAPWDVDTGRDLYAGEAPLLITCDETHDQLANFAYALGQNVLFNSLPATIVGDGTHRSFDLPQPIARVPVITLNGNPQTVGIDGVETGKDWYWNQGSTALRQDDGGTTLTPADSLLVLYLTTTPGVAQYPNTAGLQTRSAIEATSGKFDYLVSVTQPTTPAELFQQAAAWATSYGIPARTVGASTLKPGLQTGMQQHIRLPKIQVDDEFLIATVEVTTKNNVIVWSYTAFNGANVGDSFTGLVQFINRGQTNFSLVNPVPVIQDPAATQGIVGSSIAPFPVGTPLPFPKPVTAGNLLVVVCCRNNQLGNPPPISDTQGNTWSQALYEQGTPPFPNQIAVLWCFAIASGPCAVNIPGLTGAQWQAMMEFSGIDRIATVDVTGGSAGTVPPTITTTQDKDLVVTGVTDVPGIPTVTSPETLLGFEVNGTFPGIAMSYATPAAGAFTTSLTVPSITGVSAWVSVAFRKLSPTPVVTPVLANPQGTVTHLTGALNINAPVFGNGGGDIFTGAKTGNTDELVSFAGSAPAGGEPLVFDASGNAEKGTAGQLLPPGGAKGDVLTKRSATSFDADFEAPAKPTVHDEPLTDGNSNFIFAAGDIIVVVGIPN